MRIKSLAEIKERHDAYTAEERLLMVRHAFQLYKRTEYAYNTAKFIPNGYPEESNPCWIEEELEKALESAESYLNRSCEMLDPQDFECWRHAALADKGNIHRFEEFEFLKIRRRDCIWNFGIQSETGIDYWQEYVAKSFFTVPGIKDICLSVSQLSFLVMADFDRIKRSRRKAFLEILKGCAV